MPLPISEEDLKFITGKLYALYAKHGFDGISMEELSRQASVSKATLYRYFTSKEDIVRGMVDYLILHVDSMKFTAVNGIQDVLSAVREFYTKSLMVSAITSSQFLDNLEAKYPDISRSCRVSLDTMRNRFADFYAESVQNGWFSDLPFALVSRELQNMLPSLIDMNYLDQNHLTLSEAIREYFRMFLLQILRPEYLSVTSESSTYDFVEEISGSLLNDFFIDSIRR